MNVWAFFAGHALGFGRLVRLPSYSFSLFASA